MDIATDLHLTRFPSTRNKSLQAYSAADQLLLNEVDLLPNGKDTALIMNDRFGAITCGLEVENKFCSVHLQSQRQAILYNIDKNDSRGAVQLINPFEEMPGNMDVIAIQIPKSLDLFEVFLQQAANALADDGVVFCGFMTKYFTKSWLDLAGKYFSEVNQTKAYKKARLFKLTKAIRGEYRLQTKSIQNDFDLNIQQYPGVFSGKQVDHATAFLMQHMILDESIDNVLDLASGNGVLGKYVSQKSEVNNLVMVDDNIFAIESGRLNVQDADHVWNFHLKEFPSDSFHYIISNPPFHFEHEKGTEVTLNLMQQVKRCLAPNGIFQMVANKSLNYMPTLKQQFSRVDVTAQNQYYFVYTCMA